MTEQERLRTEAGPQPEPTLGELWDELLMDALASDGPIRDADVKNAVDHYRKRIEEAARTEGRQQAVRVEVLAKAIDEHVAEECPFDACFGECARPILDRVAGLNQCKCGTYTDEHVGDCHFGWHNPDTCPHNASESPPTVDEVVYEEGGEQVVIRRRVGDTSESPPPEYGWHNDGDECIGPHCINVEHDDEREASESPPTVGLDPDYTEDGDCECGQPMSAHAGGFALLHHDEVIARLRAAPPLHDPTPASESGPTPYAPESYMGGMTDMEPVARLDASESGEERRAHPASRRITGSEGRAGRRQPSEASDES